MKRNETSLTVGNGFMQSDNSYNEILVFDSAFSVMFVFLDISVPRQVALRT